MPKRARPTFFRVIDDHGCGNRLWWCSGVRCPSRPVDMASGLSSKGDEDVGHPTVKPLVLTRWLSGS
jgi:hypothetical protein